MPSYARIAVNVPSLTGVFVDEDDPGAVSAPATFDYEIPSSLEAKIRPGHLVLVPFGSRTVQGVVLREIDRPAVEQTRTIIELVDPDPVLTAYQRALAQWMAENTLAPLGTLMGLFLPPGIAQQADTEFFLTGAHDSENGVEGTSRRGVAARILRLLSDRGALRGRQIARALPQIEWRTTANQLVRRGLLGRRSVLPPATVRPKFIRTAQLAVTPVDVVGVMDQLGHTDATRERRRRALQYLIDRPQAIDVAWIYAESGCNLTDLQKLEERGLVVLREQEIWRDPLRRHAGIPPQPLKDVDAQVILTGEQQEAWQKLEAGINEAAGGQASRPFLLEGVTGSGKTELYLRATEAMLRRGRQTVVLVPEIALTPQTVNRFVSRFPGQVGLVHSRLSPGERYDTWRRARAGALAVVVGPRSALFSPLPAPGLVVADECHDPSYHQSEPPFYDGILAAEAYARICGGVFLAGSATPTVVQRYQADIGKSAHLELTTRIATASSERPAPSVELPRVTVVDLREELKAGNRSIFSSELRAALDNVLRQKQQAILFLNRRGTATYVFCRSCGYVARCPRCDMSLTYHLSAQSGLLCHRCGYRRQLLQICPECGSSDIRAYGLGTEKVEAEAQQLFPGVRTLRWDWETTRQKDAHEIILHHFAAGHADILVGTQMLAKGLDLAGVTLVGIVMADAGLFLPDPFAGERVFQLLTQVAGRAGRSTLGGRVVLQTYSPDNYAIRSAAAHDVHGFYQQELSQRRRLGYPPFSRLLRLEYRHFDPAKAEATARALERRLRASSGSAGSEDAVIIGAAPCFHAKVDGRYRWQIVLRGGNLARLLAGLNLAEWRVERDPVTLL
ncbi:MAG: primosomal protein N' [Anaerolineales bacterium]